MKFTPENFYPYVGSASMFPNSQGGNVLRLNVEDAQTLANFVNKKIEEWLKSAPKIYLNIGEYEIREWRDSGLASNELTHIGKIVDIKVYNSNND